MHNLLSGIRAFIEKSPFFQQFNPTILAGSIRFEEQGLILISGNSKATTPLGYNVFFSVLDEAAFYLDNDNRNVAEEIYNSLQRRIVSRFGKDGMIAMISSPRYTGDFIMSKLEESKISNQVYGIQLPTWKVKDPNNFDLSPSNVFYFNPEKGIISDEEPTTGDITYVRDKVFKPHAMWWQIPCEFKKSFQVNPEKAKRDFGATPSLTLEGFMPHPEIVSSAFDDELRDPVLKKGGYRMNREPLRVDYYVHVDLAKNKDGKGDKGALCMAHFDGWEQNEMGEKNKKVYVDLIEQLEADENLKEIDYEKVRQKIYALKQRGYNIKLVTFDQFQSVDSQQILKKKGIRTELLSVDRTLEPYNSLKEIIYDKRITIHPHKKTYDGLCQLELIKGAKVDHPQCFTGDTRVALLDGTNPTFEELASRFKHNEKFYVYSMGKRGICVSEAKNSRKTRITKELIEITLDNYQVIRCTPGQLFMTLGFGLVKAENLKPDISIMPLYRSKCQKGGNVDYERLYCPVTSNSHILTHHLAYENFNGKIPADHVVHHKDENKSNNFPDNLELFDRREHARYHTLKRHRTDKEWVDALRSGHKKYRENGGDEKSRENMLHLFEIGKLKKGRVVCSIEGCNEISNARGLCGKHFQYFRRQKLKAERSSKQVNHRVLSIKRIVHSVPVWDITVEKNNNYALASGVFVVNS